MLVPSLTRRGRAAREARGRRQRVERLLSRPGPPLPYADPAILEELRAQHPPRARASFEAALGTALALEPAAERVLLVVRGDRAPNELERRGRELVVARGEPSLGLGVEPGSFDLVLCNGAFVRSSDPPAALQQLVRACRPGGRVRLELGPLFPSAWGLDAGRALGVPYAQFLFTPALLRRALGDELHVGWRRESYLRLLERSGCELVEEIQRRDDSELQTVERHPDAFAGRGLTWQDLVTASMSAVLRRPE